VLREVPSSFSRGFKLEIDPFDDGRYVIEPLSPLRYRKHLPSLLPLPNLSVFFFFRELSLFRRFEGVFFAKQIFTLTVLCLSFIRQSAGALRKCLSDVISRAGFILVSLFLLDVKK